MNGPYFKDIHTIIHPDGRIEKLDDSASTPTGAGDIQLEGLGESVLAQMILATAPQDQRAAVAQMLGKYAQLHWLRAIDGMKGRINPRISPDAAKALDTLCDLMVEEYRDSTFDSESQTWEQEAK